MTTLNLLVVSGDDDAHEELDNTGFTSISDNVIMNSNASNPLLGGFRFRTVTVPNASTIDSAVWSPYVRSVTTDDPDCTVHCEAVDDSDDFVVTADVTDRARTAANTPWDVVGVGSGFQAAPAITTAVKEVVDRPGWASGQDMTVIAKGTTDTSRLFNARSYDWNSAAGAKLDIDYSPPAPTGDAFGETGEAVGVTHIRRARVVSY